MKYKIILASGSPRRKELLEQMGASFEIKVSQKEEVITSTNPKEVVKELSMMKAQDIAETVDGPAVIIGADTVVAHEGKILGKPKDKADAIRMVSGLAGDEHYVYTGVCLLIKEEDGMTRDITFAEGTRVSVYGMSEKEIVDYVESGEPMDKAGAYAIQGLFAPYIREISGDYYNIVGLPIAGIYQRLKEEGIFIK